MYERLEMYERCMRCMRCRGCMRDLLNGSRKEKTFDRRLQIFSGSIPKMLKGKGRRMVNGNIQPSQQVLLCVINIVFSYAR